MEVLIEFSFCNHRSFRGEALFSMLAATDNVHSETLVDFAGYRFLRPTLLFGANGSGKSNFVDALLFVRDLVCTSAYNRPGAGIQYWPHKLDGFGEESTYLIQFVADGTHFAYGFTLQQHAISKEHLYYYPNEEQTTVFERFGGEMIVGDSFHGVREDCQGELQENRLLLSCAAKFSEVELIAKAYRFFAEKLVLYTPGNQEQLRKECLCQISADESLKAAVLRMLQDMDTGIQDIAVKVDPERLRATARTFYDGFSLDLDSEESRGVQKLLVLAWLLTDTIRKGKVLVVDDLDAGLHQSLVYELMKWFIAYKGTPVAQFIATTQETTLLDLDLFRRDQIWLVEMDRQKRTSKLYSLVELIGVRPDENAYRCYLQGKYGGIPELHLDKSDLPA